MKNLTLFCMVCFAACGFAGCGQALIQDAYHPELPPLPPIWEEILGSPYWRLEWINEKGNWVSWEGKEGFPELTLIQEWTNPVFAWPYWPEKGIIPAQVFPAGALFPWDARENRLILDWDHGVDAFFWKELSLHNKAQNKTGTPRLPWYFDWPRFRELMKSEDIPDEVLMDPWMADWKNIAQRTAESGFDRRRIRAEPKTKISIPGEAAVWIGRSVFAKPIIVNRREPLIINAGEEPETWFSEKGMIRCQKSAWIFIPWIWN